MKVLLITALLVLPLTASAEYMDAIEVTINEDCSVAEYVAIKNDFNSQWGEANGYLAEIATPIQGPSLTSVFWVGRTANATAFGQAWDTWRTALEDPESTASKLSARLTKCSTNMNRSGFDLR
jgi:hypothetical protein